jgi:hypothetical protein
MLDDAWQRHLPKCQADLFEREIVANQTLVVLTYPSTRLFATIARYLTVRTVGLRPVSGMLQTR